MQKELWDISQLNVFHDVVGNLARRFCQGVVYLEGDLGVGKTALVRHWLQVCGVRDPVTSPSYQIVNMYEAAGRRFLHADLYRLVDPEELLYLDVREWQVLADLIFIEWPGRGGEYLPAPDIICQLSLSENVRTMCWQVVHN